VAENSFVAALKELDPNLFLRLHSEITEERLGSYLQPLADVLAPSQTVRHTRAPVLEQLLQTEGVLKQTNVHFERDYQKTGNCVLLLGRQPRCKRIWLMAHLDSISYFVESATDDGYLLLPFCYHMMHPGQRAAAAVAYDLETCGYGVAAHGDIVTEADGKILFKPHHRVSLHPGHRICFYSRLSWDRDSGQLRGNLDDVGAAVSLVLAAIILADYDVELMVGLTDEEEGVSATGNQTIGRGGARLLRYFDQPELVIVSDIHEAVPMLEGSGPVGLEPGDGACFAEKASRGRGAVTPPSLYELQRKLASELAGEGIRLRENRGGYIGRSEGVNAMLRTPNVALIGFLGENRHFDRDVTSANIRDLVDLARVVICLVLLTQTPIWREVLGL